MSAGGYLSYFPALTLKSTLTINKETMKKLLFVFVLGAFTACGNGGSDSTTDSTSMTTDTTTMSSGSSSSMSSDTSSKMSGDTSKMAADTGAMSTPH